VIGDFAIVDPEGHKVLVAKEIGAALDLQALASHVIRMPGGHARSVALLLRRGKSGRISLAEALGKRDPGETATWPIPTRCHSHCVSAAVEA
jgi:hypothetical protein